MLLLLLLLYFRGDAGADLGDRALLISSSCSTSTVIGDSGDSVFEVVSKSGTETPRLGGRE